MIVVRITHLVKPGRASKLVELLQEYRDHPATRGGNARIYTSSWGPMYTEVWEQEFESEAQRLQVWDSGHQHPMMSTFWERVCELVEAGGQREIWNLK